MSLRSAGLLLVMAACACTAARHGEAPPRPLPRGARAKVEQPPPVPAFHWEPLEVSIDPSLERTTLPLVDDDLEWLGEARREVDALPAAARDGLYTHGFAIVPRATPPAAMSALYRELDDAGLPVVVTVDALGEAVHAAVAATLAEVEHSTIEPTVARVLARVGARFDAMTRDAPTDLARPLRMARGVVAVAAVLLDPRTRVPADLEADVREEARRVQAAKAPAESVLLGVPVDYSAARLVAGADPRRAPVAHALAWLGLAPFVLTGRDVALGPRVSVAAARDATRAALLFAFALHPRVDAEAAAEWQRLEALEEFLVGPSDDWSPADLAALGATLGLDVTRPRDLVDVTRIDRLRATAAARFRARVHDGGGSLAWIDPAGTSKEVRENRFVSRFVAPSARVFGGRVGLDAVVQQALVHPVIGAYRGNRSVATLERGRRVLSRPLDFAAVLGSAEARAALAGEGDDAYENFDATLRKLVDRRPPEREATRHASVYLSALDLVASLLAPSAADAATPAAVDAEYKKRTLEAALASYATLRHDFAGAGRRLPSPPVPRVEHAGKTPLVLVEPHPEAIARMVAMVRQLQRGLAAYHALAPGSAATQVVASVERLLTLAFETALLMGNGIPPSEDQSRALATLPDWFAALESAVDASAARVVDMHVDLASGRVLAQGTGAPELLVIALRDPKSERLVVGFGAAARHLELVHARTEPIDDAEWRARVARSAIAPPPWTASFHTPLRSEVKAESEGEHAAEADR